MPNLYYGDPFKVEASIKNTGSKDYGFRTWVRLKREGGYHSYAYIKPWIASGQTKQVVIDSVVPGSYPLRVPAHALMTENPVLLAVWNDKELDHKEIVSGFTANPKAYMSLGIKQHTACEGVDSNTNPINPKTVFSSSEKLYFFMKTAYDPRGFRITFTVESPSYLPWTVYGDVPPNENWSWYAMWVHFNSPLPRGTWNCWIRSTTVLAKDTVTVR